MEYTIVYDFCGDFSDEYGIVETFTGTWDELQDYIKQLRKSGAYNIEANAVGD